MAVRGAPELAGVPANHTGAGVRRESDWFQEKESALHGRQLGFTVESGLAASSDGAGSALFALVGDIQFELRSFKAHQHTAELVPVDLATIDHEKRDASGPIVVPGNPATHHSMIRDLRSMCVVGEMVARQGAAHLFD